MKQNYVLLFLILLISNAGFGQLIQASLGPGLQPNSVKVYIKPATTQTPANISTLQFNLGIDTSISPKPSMSVMSTTLSGVTWTVTEATEGGYYNYQLTTASVPLTPNTTANTELEIMELVFNGGPVTSKNVSLVSLPDGGLGASQGNSFFYCTGSYNSDGSNLYYSRSGVTVNNQFSYDATGATSGTTTSTATISGILLPIKWLDFSVIRQSNSAFLQWSVTNSGNISEFEIEKSVNGVDFTPVSSIRNASALQTGSFKFSDAELTSYNSTIVFYRIKQKDINGQISYSDIRSLRLNLKGNIVMYPNPATTGFYLQVPFVNPGSKKVLLQLRNALNQIVDKREVTETQASNYYFDLKNNAIQTGNYSLQIYSDGKLLDTKNVMISK